MATGTTEVKGTSVCGYSADPATHKQAVRGVREPRGQRLTRTVLAWSSRISGMFDCVAAAGPWLTAAALGRVGSLLQVCAADVTTQANYEASRRRGVQRRPVCRGVVGVQSAECRG